ncbi:H+ transporting ATPase, P-type ATPase [Alteracholeplasma palmae J233]|uniref:H+ transporting ATPase, P-type ATPase n=1 Tax=Alteracholeplasma palmae (strain ATCC 49389 / J233) TaxID=1318466 RepID=U4KQH9_ALTPJ|nr:HAD-IC family P-type ATPase [Alteracholeplasma palmae]CCV64610.1 H+ transporting ATPase, P-type ATPase [Alteracholeplasma palmae J233]
MLKGLSQEEVEKRIQEKKVNITKKGSSKRISEIIFTNVFTFFNMLSIGIVIWLITINEHKNAMGVFIIFANTMIGIIQEIKAKKAIDKLSLINEEKVVVIREGNYLEINPKNIVLNDLVVFTKGKQIIVDGKIKEGTLEINESLLTGEAKPVIKTIGDQVHAGSFVVSGKAVIEALFIGKDTYVEKLTKEAKIYKKPQSEIFRSLQLMMRYIGVIIIPLGLLLFFIALNDGVAYKVAVKSISGALLGMIPSGLFLLTSTALAASVVKLSKSKVLVQELYCIETLARVNVLCLDKTGTITDGTMSVYNTLKINTLDNYDNYELISEYIKSQNNDNETSQAIEIYFNKSQLNFKIKNNMPFSSERKYSYVEYQELGKFFLGAPEFILKENYHVIKEEVEKQASNGYRVLLFAYEENEKIVPLEIILVEDNIRSSALDTIKFFKENDVKIKIISGDNPITVSNIAKKVEVDGAELYCDLTNMSDEEVKISALKYNVFGRSNPEQKRIIIRTLKEHKYKVAMTGDGVNDILALKEADTSIALASGSEAARNVSQLVLMDSDFSSMPKVVVEGRKVINNIEMVAVLFLTKTIFSVLLAVLTLFFSTNYPLIPIQLTLISFFTIGFPAFLLAFQPNKKLVTGRFSYNILLKTIPGSFVVAFFCLVIYALSGFLKITDTKTVSSLVFYTTVVTTYMVLFKTCLKLNLFRKILLSVMAVGISFYVLVFPKFFELVALYHLKINELIFLAVLCSLIYPVYKLFSLITEKIIKKRISKWYNI